MKTPILWFTLLLTCRHTAAAVPVTGRRAQQPAWVDGLKNGLASALAAGCVKTSLQPIDAIKTIQQYQQAKGTASLTIWEACREIVSRPGGFWNFYAGLGVTVFGAMPSVALYFGVYSYCKKTLLNSCWGKKHPTASVALSAAIGNSVASFSRVPYEVLKQQLQTGVYTSTWHAFKEISSSKEYMSLLFPKGGIAIQMLRDVPYAVITLMLYETLQDTFHKSRSNKLIDFCVGGAAGGFGSWATNPTDVIKTRLQTNSELYGGSVRTCTAEIWREGGAMAFLRGSIPRLVHKVPANAFFFVFYEGFRQLLGVRDNETASKND
jgi:solute carrier family 25 S-adenosylmethionine transporter 26